MCVIQSSSASFTIRGARWAIRLVFTCTIAATPVPPAESQVETNVIYGMYSGLALLMDVYYPAQPNGHGVVFIAGSGWHAPLAYGAPPLKASRQTEIYGPPLNQAGYKVFAVNHRAAPRFRYPAAVDDLQRAVRFIRYHAEAYGINPDSIGGVGGSSGGHLISMLGTLDGKGDPEDPDPINRLSAKLQCVVARAAPADFVAFQEGSGVAAVTSFLGMRFRGADRKSEEYRVFWEASPINHVSADDPPFLLMHGDADSVVPFEQAELMERALAKAGVPVRLLRIAGGEHGPTFGNLKGAPDYIGAMISWLNRYLLKP